MAGIYDRYVLPHLIQCACAAKTLNLKRAELIPQARGTVIEIGCGGGLNFGLYDSARVTRVVGLDPSAQLLRMAQSKAAQASVPIELVEGVGEALPFPDASFDTAVLTFTLCSVGDPAASLGEVRRVLKPGGVLLFCEHGLAPDPDVRRWQGRIEPVWKKIAGGCHLTRPVGGALRQAGFATSGGGQGYLMAPRFAGWVEWGLARASG